MQKTVYRADQSRCHSKQRAEKNLLPPSSLKSCPAGNPNAFYNDSTLFFLYNDLAFGFSGTLIQIFWFSYFLRRSQLAEIISSQQMNINLDWGEQNHFKLGVINPQNNKSGPCIRGILTLPYLPYFISIIYGLWRHQNQRCKKRRIWQIYLGYFSEAVLIFGPCTRAETASTALSGLCAVRTVLLALYPLHSARRIVLGLDSGHLYYTNK